jgi:hypothetical protein
MKIKVSQLRKIIREEVERSLETSPSGIAATIADAAGVGTPEDFAGVANKVAEMIAGTYDLGGASPQMALENILDMALFDAGGLEPFGGTINLAREIAAHYNL